ncbi:MAG: WYL domain-containing protein [Ardenticatenales bacterium]|nr:WYL domain-containing protein [Ardenticatenales bacterium]
MQSLATYLDRATYWELMAVAWTHNVKWGKARPRKNALVGQLADLLPKPHHLDRVVRGLSVEERSALETLVAAEGRMPWDIFQEWFGDIRPIQPHRKGLALHPERAPRSTSERLAYSGLIFRHPRVPKPGEVEEVHVPVELLWHLPAPKALPQPSPLPDESPGQSIPSLLDDLTLFLSLLHRERVIPHYGRWVAMRYLHDLNQRTRVPQALAGVEHERQAKYWALLHFLAEAAGLVSLVGKQLLPSVEGWAWLHADQATRYQRVWEAWQRVPPALWQRYQLPGHEQPEPPHLMARLLHHLADAESHQRYDLAAFMGQVMRQDPAFWDITTFWEAEVGEDRAMAFLTEMLTEPLAWCQLVEVWEEEEKATFGVTPLGHWLLTGKGTYPFPEEHREGVEVAEDLTLFVPLSLSAAPLVQLEAMAEWRGWDEDGRLYQLTQQSVVAALRHLTPNAILYLLDEATGYRLTEAQSQHIQAFMADTLSTRLHRTVLLETRSSDEMKRLTTHSSVRRHLGQTYSPRVVEVPEANVGSLCKALQRKGIHLPPPEALPEPLPLAHLAGESDAATYLLLACQLYQALQEWVSLPLPMPATLLSHLAAALDEGKRTLVQQVADDLLADLTYAMEGWAPRHQPGAGMPLAQSLPLLEEAIREEWTLEMQYWVLGRGLPSQRRVEPHRLDTLGSVPYLIAYCHEAQRVLIFRVDNIGQLEQAL